MENPEMKIPGNIDNTVMQISKQLYQIADFYRMLAGTLQERIDKDKTFDTETKKAIGKSLKNAKK